MTVILKIEKLVYGGSGVGFMDKKPIFVPMSAPGDEVEIKINKQHKGYAEAQLLKILKGSPNRVLPKCEYFGRCGGCQWQHLDYAAQILWKQLILEEQLKRIGKIKDPNVLPTVPSPKAWNYRDRVKFQKGVDGRTGFFAPGTHELIEIKNCLIAGTEDVCKDFFTQINPGQNKHLQMLVASLVEELNARVVLELYCGNGNLTFPIAKIANDIIASDSNKKAIQTALGEASRLGVTNVEFTCQSAKSAISSQFKKPIDCVVLDPPRDGCKDILAGLLRLKPASIIYVSCNPSTLARDIHVLAKNGYTLEKAQPIDMFPQTYHIESVSCLQLS